ncbi:MAG: FecR domain-containing protein [Sideroxydans sp.]|nr:FecR domain-containing protein [Sideroxydans sp.]
MRASLQAISGLSICLLLLCLTTPAHAAEGMEVVKSTGHVTSGDIEGSPGQYRVNTGAGGRAVVSTGATGFIVVEQNSTVEIDRSGPVEVFRQISGMIYYAMNKIDRSMRAAEVRTKTAVIGVRGTRFMVVEQPERQEIGMRKGEVRVISPAEEFEIHRQQVTDEFAAFRKEGKDAVARERQAFKEYQARTQREFVEFKREFSLQTDRMVAFSGRRVTETALSATTRNEMAGLEQFAAEWLSKVRD